MMRSSSARPADPAAGRYIPWLFVGGFLTVVAVNAIMVGFAINSFSGVATPKHYLEGLAYNRLLEATRAQQALGWRIVLTATPRAAADTDIRAVDLSVTARDALDRPLDNIELRALAVRPTRAGLDQAVTLTHGGNGTYRATIELPLPGQWDLRLIANRPDAHWQAVHRLQVP